MAASGGDAPTSPATQAAAAGTPKRMGLILARFDPVAVDAVGGRLLGHDPAQVACLRLVQGVLGDMTSTRIVEG